MKTRLITAAVLLGTLCAAPLGAQQFFKLPVGSWVNDVTPDGSTVVGTWNFGDGFIWNWQTDPAPTVVLGGDLVGISNDGTAAVGTIIDAGTGAQVAARWTAAGGWENLGWLPNALSCPSRSNGYDISGDGTVIVGLSWDGCNGRGFRWTSATGMQELQNLGNGNNRASAISGDGSLIGGFAQGSFSRTPAYWDASTAGQLIDFEDLGEVYGFNEDGSLSVGEYIFPGQNLPRAFVRNNTTGAMSNLGSLNSAWSGAATDMSEDGGTVAGYDISGLARQAWVWTPGAGIVSMNDLVVSLGLPATDPLFVSRAVSDDGNVIVGGGYAGGGGPFGYGGFILVQSDVTWSDLGGGTAGINGVPSLSGTGSLVGGTTAGLDLTDAAPSALALAWMSFASAPVAAIGGTVHATPFTNQFLFGTNAAGEFSASTTWPVGVPAGTEVWFQFIVQDASSIHGLTLSNGLKAITP